MDTYCSKCDEISEIKIESVKETFNIRGDEIAIQSQVAICKNCGERLFNQELDEKNLTLAYSIYRTKHNLLSPTAILNIRKKYALSQRALAQLLGWGEVTIHRYESGAIQDPAHNDVLILIDDTKNMKELFEKNNHFLNATIRQKLKNRIDELLKEEFSPKNRIDLLEQWFLCKQNIDEYSGFIKFNLEKIVNMIIYIAEKTEGVFTTKLNKLLWYSDFLCFKEYTTSISGSDYVHLPLGPVPNDYKWILAAAIDENVICEEEISCPSGYTGEQYKALVKANDEWFSPEEKKVMDFVIDYFKDYNSEDIKERSHKEIGYKNTRLSEKISYRYASDLSISVS